MNVTEWLDSRSPAPPPTLARRIREALASQAGVGSADAHTRLAAGAEEVLARLLDDRCDHRASALDLLVADALMTYAFEAAADDPSTIERRAHDAMRRIAQLGRESSA
ncbi:MAG: hypothetical protein NVS1B4_22400 [Gemmatimonadaceae bacterium]